MGTTCLKVYVILNPRRPTANMCRLSSRLLNSHPHAARPTFTSHWNSFRNAGLTRTKRTISELPILSWSAHDPVLVEGKSYLLHGHWTELTQVSMAWMEMRIVLAKLYYTFDIELLDQDLDWHRDCKMYLIWQRPMLKAKLSVRKNGTGVEA